MKKTLYSIGVLLVVGIFAYYAATTLGKNDQGNQNTNTNAAVDDMSNWQTFTAFDNSFSIKYPSDWKVATPGYDSVISGERNLGIYSDNPMSSDFAMGIIWSENEGISDCTSWIEKTYNDFIDEYPDMVESAKAWSYPISLLNLNGKEVCRKPDVYAHEYYAEQYVITNNGLEFDINFPNKDGGLYITDPVEKNAIAHQILNSIEYK